MPFSEIRRFEWLAILVATMFFFGSWATYRAYADADRLVNKTVDASRQFTLCRDAVQAAQRGQRGFLLTGKDHYLEPYRAGVKEFRQHAAHAETLCAEDAQQMSRIRNFRKAAEDLFAELEMTVRKVQDGDKPGAFGVVATDYGDKQIRMVLSAIDDCVVEEDRHLGIAAGDEMLLFRLFISTAVLVGAAVAIAGYFAVRAYRGRPAGLGVR